MTNNSSATVHGNAAGDDDDGSIVGDDDPRPSCAICWRAFNNTNRRQRTPCTDVVCRQAKTFCAECVLTYTETFANDRKNYGKPFLCPNCRTGTWGPPLPHTSSLHPSGFRASGVRRPPSSPLSPRTQRRRSDSYNPQHRTYGFQDSRLRGVPGSSSPFAQPLPYGARIGGHVPGPPPHISMTYHSPGESFEQPTHFMPAFHQSPFYQRPAYQSLDRPVRGVGVVPHGTPIPPPNQIYGPPIPFAQIAARQAAAARSREMLRRQQPEASMQRRLSSPRPPNIFNASEETLQNRMPMQGSHEPQQVHLNMQHLPTGYGQAPPTYQPAFTPRLPAHQHTRARPNLSFGTLSAGTTAQPGDPSSGFVGAFDRGIESTFENLPGYTAVPHDFGNPLAPAPQFGHYSNIGRNELPRNAISHWPEGFPGESPPSQSPSMQQNQSRPTSFATPSSTWQGNTTALNRDDHNEENNDDEEEHEEEEDLLVRLRRMAYIAEQSFMGARPVSRHNHPVERMDDDGAVFYQEHGDGSRERKRPRLG